MKLCWVLFGGAGLGISPWLGGWLSWAPSWMFGRSLSLKASSGFGLDCSASCGSPGLPLGSAFGSGSRWSL